MVSFPEKGKDRRSVRMLTPTVIGEALNPVQALEDFLTTNARSWMVSKRNMNPRPYADSECAFVSVKLAFKQELVPLGNFRRHSFRYGAATEAFTHAEDISKVLGHSAGFLATTSGYVVRRTKNATAIRTIFPALKPSTLTKALAEVSKLTDPWQLSLIHI